MFNQIKTVILLGTLTGLLLVVGQLLGGTSGLTIALGFALFMNAIGYWYSDKIVLFMYKAKPASKSEHSRLFEMVREVTSRASMPMPKVFIVPSSQSNAFATGRNPKHAAVAVTHGIMELLSERELKGVIAHEIAHIKNRDILISTVAAVIAGAISYIAFIARWGAIFGGFGGRGEGGRNMMELLALAFLTPLIATIVRLAISRSREFLADSTGARIIHDPYSLADALTKLNASVRANPMRMGTEATSHMFIVNPFSAQSFLKLFSTHPPLQERVGKLRAMSL